MIKAIGRLLLASIFISGGSLAFINPGPRAINVARAGIPQAHLATILNGAIMVVAGSALALNLSPKLAAAILAGALIPTTLVGHPFWREQDATAHTGQRAHFMKNLAMLGGLLLVISDQRTDKQ
jgi:putative oxidoreductase